MLNGSKLQTCHAVLNIIINASSMLLPCLGSCRPDKTGIHQISLILSLVQLEESLVQLYTTLTSSMSPKPHLPPLLQILLLASIATTSAVSHTTKSSGQSCQSFRCGQFTIRYPFWIATNDNTSSTNYYCGRPELQLSCQNQTPVLTLPNNASYHVKDLIYSSHTLILEDPDLTNSTCPKPRQNFSVVGVPEFEVPHVNLTYLINCSRTFPVQRLPCKANRETYVLVDGLMDSAPEWWRWCDKALVAPVQLVKLEERGLVNHEWVVNQGVRLNWSFYRSDACARCEASNGSCGNNSQGTCLCSKDNVWHEVDCCNTKGKWEPFLGIIIFAAIAVTSIPIAILIVHYNFYSLANPLLLLRNMKFKNIRNVERFLRVYGELMPKRYRYADVKKMTNSFRDKLGKGGYGSVFKGRLTDGRLVAVKLLNDSRGNGGEFVNEVACIGATSHVNIVTLLGFCSEGSKRALIYEFMPNGSLERFIYVREQRDVSPLSWEKLYTIALGIARGLEYLHSGCNAKILHFDIKPHNILLDENFCPKISDFGLAKLCLSKNSVVSMNDQRGTLGYIAPEIWRRHFEDVSSKSDVYSYGMMVLEMVGGRHNLEAKAERMSQIYFPDWIYDHLSVDGVLKSCGVTNDVEEETARKMVLVGMWCIQNSPSERPSMKRVIDMLEGSLGDLPMPPKPYMSSPPRSSSHHE